MKIILINGRHGGSRAIELGRWSRALLSLCCLGLPLGIVAGAYLPDHDGDSTAVRGVALDTMRDELDEQALELEALQRQARHKLKALTLNMAELQARMTRLDALGEHLTAMAKLEDGEFDFSQPPALGGPQTSEAVVEFSTRDLNAELGRFETQLSDREQQLAVLESLLANRNLEDQSWLSGRPVEKGWISSYYGKRTDPFSGQLAMHNGIDFAGKEGSNVLAAAAGVVTWPVFAS